MQGPIRSQNEIVEMFNKVSTRYDFLNCLMSLGMDNRWRRINCQRTLSFMEKDNIKICDVACGTGDMLIFWKEATKKRQIKVDTFLGVDPAISMLQIASRKIEFAHFLEGSATNMPIESHTQDLVSVAYGFRNILNIDEALAEVYRILKPDGFLSILEFTRPLKINIIQKAVRAYIKKIIPFVGSLISEDKEAYMYLPLSIECFLTKEELVQKLREAGFEIKRTIEHSFNISTTIIAQKVRS